MSADKILALKTQRRSGDHLDHRGVSGRQDLVQRRVLRPGIRDMDPGSVHGLAGTCVAPLPGQGQRHQPVLDRRHPGQQPIWRHGQHLLLQYPREYLDSRATLEDTQVSELVAIL